MENNHINTKNTLYQFRILVIIIIFSLYRPSKNLQNNSTLIVHNIHGWLSKQNLNNNTYILLVDYSNFDVFW